MEDWISLSPSSCEPIHSSLSDTDLSDSSLSELDTKKYYIQGEYINLCKLLEQIDLSEVLTVDV